MRSVIALIVAFAALAGMYAGSEAVYDRLPAWEASGRELPAAAMWAIKGADFFHSYWYIVAVIVLMLCLGIAAILPGNTKQDA
jgi:type II secretory pathway component PulF